MFLLSGITSFEIFGRAIPIYGTFAVLGFLAALVFCLLTAPTFGINRDDISYICVFGGVGAVIGAKLLYMLVSINQIVADVSAQGFKVLLDVYLPGGMVFYGGLLGAFLGALLGCHFFGLSLRSLFPCLIPGFALAHGISRLGCFFAGCCYGTHTAGRFSVIYKNSAFAPNGQPLVPVQLIESCFEILLAIVLLLSALVLTKKAAGRSVIRTTHPGWYASVQTSNKNGFLIFGLYLLFYGVFRFALEFFRGDEIRGFIGLLSTSQWISIAAVVTGLALVIYSNIDNRI